MLIKSNNYNDHHNSRSNSLKSEYGGRDCKEFSGIPCGSALRSPLGPAQQIHTSHEAEHTVSAQHTQSQVAMYLIVPLPSPKGGLLFSLTPPPPKSPNYFDAHLLQVTNHLCFFCSRMGSDLLGVLTLHTSVSILLLVCCTFPCQPCTYGRSLVPAGHLGLDRTEESRWTIILLKL